MKKQSRRGFAGLILGLFAAPWRANTEAPTATSETPPRPDRTGGAGDSASEPQSRRYRADAAILLFGITIYRRTGVGGGEASIRETKEGGAARKTLFFAAGSDPKRARGLSRLGWIREVVAASGPSPTEATYFGVLTSSPEESLEGAQKSTAEPAPDRSIYSAVNGRNTVGHSRSAIKRFEFTSDAKWSDQRLITEAQSNFHASVNWRETSWPAYSASAPPTFLFELARLLQERARRASGRYVYNEQEYRLELEVEQPERRGNKPGQMLAGRGRVQNLRTGRRTDFRLGLEDSPKAIVPFRIEFQPRSFLRLTFEAVGAPGS